MSIEVGELLAEYPDFWRIWFHRAATRDPPLDAAAVRATIASVPPDDVVIFSAARGAMFRGFHNSCRGRPLVAAAARGNAELVGVFLAAAAEHRGGGRTVREFEEAAAISLAVRAAIVGDHADTARALCSFSREFLAGRGNAGGRPLVDGLEAADFGNNTFRELLLNREIVVDAECACDLICVTRDRDLIAAALPCATPLDTDTFLEDPTFCPFAAVLDGRCPPENFGAYLNIVDSAEEERLFSEFVRLDRRSVRTARRNCARLRRWVRHRRLDLCDAGEVCFARIMDRAEAEISRYPDAEDSDSDSDSGSYCDSDGEPDGEPDDN